MMDKETRYTDDERPPSRWSQRQRLEFIDSKLYWERVINRRELVEHFGISLQQASADLGTYNGLAPSNLEYDRNAKLYRTRQMFSPIFRQPDPANYLNTLCDAARETGENGRNSLTFDMVRIPGRSIRSPHLISVLQAIRAGEDLQLVYQSMRSPIPFTRWVAPHALANDGMRWHMRAWCHESNEFRDFVLSRIMQVDASRQSVIDSAKDTWWNDAVRIVVQPNPGLTDSQRRAIEVDFGMNEGKLIIVCRKAMAFYYLRQLQLVSTPDTPQSHPIELANRAELLDVVHAGTK